jgi:hypothetical protein
LFSLGRHRRLDDPGAGIDGVSEPAPYSPTRRAKPPPELRSDGDRLTQAAATRESAPLFK